jgi:hypothetical protein
VEIQVVEILTLIGGLCSVGFMNPVGVGVGVGGVVVVVVRTQRLALSVGPI